MKAKRYLLILPIILLAASVMGAGVMGLYQQPRGIATPYWYGYSAGAPASYYLAAPTLLANDTACGIAATQTLSNKTIASPTFTGLTLGVSQGGTGLATFGAVGAIPYSTAATTLAALAKGTAYQTLQMNSGDTAPEWSSGEALLSTTTISLGADGNTTILTVPAGRRVILTKAVLVAAADAGTSTLTVGQAGALTDFLSTQTLSGIDAQYDVAVMQPVPNATPVLRKSYAAGTVIKAVVGSHAGSAGNTLMLYGIVY